MFRLGSGYTRRPSLRLRKRTHNDTVTNAFVSKKRYVIRCTH